MKKHVKLLLVCLTLWFGCSETFAQSTQSGLGALGHSPLFGGVPLRYVGWDASAASNAIPLSIEHRGTNNINFGTGGIQRMTILGTSSGASTGFVGIGVTNPTDILHLHDGPNSALHITSTSTGSATGIF